MLVCWYGWMDGLGLVVASVIDGFVVCGFGNWVVVGVRRGFVVRDGECKFSLM